MANDLHHDDALWLWAVKAAHVFVEWRTQGIMDPVLHGLFSMGLFDWTGEDNRLNQTTPAITGGEGIYNQWIHCDLIVIF